MEKEAKIELPKPIDVETMHRKLDFFSESNPIRRWGGYDLIDVMFYLYLFNKYKNNCLIKYKGVTSKNALGVELQIKQRMSAIDKNIYLKHLVEVANQLANCIKGNPSSIIIPLYLKLPKGGHANVLIYRHNGNVIEHFEPHGKKYSSRDDKINDLINKKLDEFIHILNTLLVKYKKRPVTIIRASDVCPMNMGLQAIEGRAVSKKLRLEGSGYCAAWSMFFTELALKNPNISSNELLNIVYDKLNDVDKNTVGEMAGPDYLRKVIIGYINLIYQKIEKYFSFMLGEKVTGDKLTEMLKKGNYQHIMSDFKPLIDIEMELLNNPSLTKEQYLIILQNKLSITKDPIQIADIQRQIDILERMNLLLNPSPPSKERIKSISKASSKSNKKISPKSITKKNRKTTVELEEVVVDDIVSGPKTPDYPPPSEKISPKREDTPIELESLSSVSSLVITPNCPEGKVFDREKGRCVKIRKTKKDITHPGTPKQPSKKTKTQKLKPCPEGEERNPKTGRCRKIKVYPPCPPGQIRDPTTHRCRKQK